MISPMITLIFDSPVGVMVVISVVPPAGVTVATVVAAVVEDVVISRGDAASVGTAVVSAATAVAVGVGTAASAQIPLVMVLESRVTAPFLASNCP